MITLKRVKGSALTHTELDDNFEGSVNLFDNQTIDGVKTFLDSPIVPTPLLEDNSTKVATTAFVKMHTITSNKVSMSQDIIIIVGPTGDYVNFQDAVDYCKTLDPQGLYKINIVLQNSFQFTNTIFFRDFDFSHITITTENYLSKLTANDFHNSELGGNTVSILDSDFIHVSQSKSPTTQEQWNDPYILDIMVLENCTPPIFSKLYLTYTGLIDVCGDGTDFKIFKTSNLKGRFIINDLILGFGFKYTSFEDCELDLSIYFYNVDFYNRVSFVSINHKSSINVYFGKSSNTLGYLNFSHCSGLHVTSSNNWLSLYNSFIDSTIQITTTLSNFEGHDLDSSRLNLYYEKGVSGSISFSNYYKTELSNASILSTRYDLSYVAYRDVVQQQYTLTPNTWTQGGVYYTNLLPI